MQIILREEDYFLEEENFEKNLTINTKKIIEISNKENYNHIVNVMRKNINDQIYIVFKNKKYYSKIEKIDKENKKIILSYNENNIEIFEGKNYEITIFQGIPKSDKFEEILDKSVQLGADEIHLVEFERSIVRKKDINEKKILRWNKKILNSMEQSKRISYLKLKEVLDFNQFIESIKKSELNEDLNLIILYEDEENIQNKLKNILESLKQKINNNKENKEEEKEKENKKIKIAILIGPEGGISKEEINKLKKIREERKPRENKENIFEFVKLGNRILRTEVAAPAILSILNYELEEF